MKFRIEMEVNDVDGSFAAMTDPRERFERALSQGFPYAKVKVTEAMQLTHWTWTYGSGMVGCLYDNSGWASTEAQAVEDVLFIFEDMPEEEITEAKENMQEYRSHYFSEHLRHEAGADYVEVSECDCDDPEANHGEAQE